jgi:hypothetical protein
LKPVIQMRSQKSKEALREMCKYLKDNGVKNMVVIGVYAGDDCEIYSEYFDKIYCVDPWKPGYDENDPASYSNMEEVEKMFDMKSMRHPNLIKMKMTSEEAFEIIKHSKALNIDIHFVYIDGNHTYISVHNDIKMWKEIASLFIGGHDYSPTMWKNVKRAINEYFSEDIIKEFYDTSWVVRLTK